MNVLSAIGVGALVAASTGLGVVVFLKTKQWYTEAHLQHKDYPDGTVLQARESWKSDAQRASVSPVRDLSRHTARPLEGGMASVPVRDSDHRPTVH